jgi:hypothetical protein
MPTRLRCETISRINILGTQFASQGRKQAFPGAEQSLETVGMNDVNEPLKVVPEQSRPCDPWTGCDWPTEFGPMKLDLNGIRSRQALTVASATRGAESEQWRLAAIWLATVESDAARARDIALRLAELGQQGFPVESDRLRLELLELENKYPQRRGNLVALDRHLTVETPGNA